MDAGRAPILTDGPKTGNYKVGPLTDGVPLRVSRADVADFMLACAAEGKFVRERPVISGPREEGEEDKLQQRMAKYLAGTKS